MRPNRLHSLRTLALFGNYVLMPIYATLILFISFSVGMLLSLFSLWAPYYLLTALISIIALRPRPSSIRKYFRIAAILCHAAILTHMAILLVPPSAGPARGHITSMLSMFAPLIGTSILTIIAAALYRSRFAPPLCPVCGHDLRGSPASTCPECGTSIDIPLPTV